MITYIAYKILDTIDNKGTVKVSQFYKKLKTWEFVLLYYMLISSIPTSSLVKMYGDTCFTF